MAGVEGRELGEMRGDQSHAGPVGRLVGIVGHGKDGGFYSEGSFGRDLSRRCHRKLTRLQCCDWMAGARTEAGTLTGQELVPLIQGRHSRAGPG